MEIIFENFITDFKNKHLSKHNRKIIDLLNNGINGTFMSSPITFNIILNNYILEYKEKFFYKLNKAQIIEKIINSNLYQKKLLFIDEINNTEEEIYIDNKLSKKIINSLINYKNLKRV